MTMGIDGRVAIVTGAAGGIGAAVVRTLHRLGAAVAAVDLPHLVHGPASSGLTSAASEASGARREGGAERAPGPARAERAPRSTASGPAQSDTAPPFRTGPRIDDTNAQDGARSHASGQAGAGQTSGEAAAGTHAGGGRGRP